VVFHTQSCSAGGIYTVPAGKALIITGVDFYTSAQILGEGHQLVLTFGHAAKPCTSFAAAAIDADNELSQNQVFEPGIPIPAGDALGLTSDKDIGTAEIYGYLVPAAVPHNVMKNVHAAGRGGIVTIEPRR